MFSFESILLVVHVLAFSWLAVAFLVSSCHSVWYIVAMNAVGLAMASMWFGPLGLYCRNVFGDMPFSVIRSFLLDPRALPIRGLPRARPQSVICRLRAPPTSDDSMRPQESIISSSVSSSRGSSDGMLGCFLVVRALMACLHWMTLLATPPLIWFTFHGLHPARSILSSEECCFHLTGPAWYASMCIYLHGLCIRISRFVL